MKVHVKAGGYERATASVVDCLQISPVRQPRRSRAGGYPPCRAVRLMIAALGAACVSATPRASAAPAATQGQPAAQQPVPQQQPAAQQPLVIQQQRVIQGQPAPQADNRSQAATQRQALPATNTVQAASTLHRQVTVLFSNASVTDALKSLSDSADVQLTLDRNVDPGALLALTVVARQTPFLPLLQQIAELEGLGVATAGDGYLLYPLPLEQQAYAMGPSRGAAAGKSGRNGFHWYLSPNGGNSYGGNKPQNGTGGYGAQGSYSGQGGYGGGGPATGQPDQPLARGGGAEGSAGQYVGGAGGGAGYPAAPASAPPATGMPGASPAGMLPAGARPSQSAPVLETTSPVPSPRYGGEVSQQAAGASADGRNGNIIYPPPASVAGQAGLQPYVTNNYYRSVAIQDLLRYVLQYAQGSKPGMLPPRQVMPDLRTSAGCLQYIAVVTEALTQNPGPPLSQNLNVDRARYAATNSTARLQALLTEAEQFHQSACLRERLQTEIAILQTRIQGAAPAARSVLGSLLLQRQQHLTMIGR